MTLRVIGLTTRDITRSVLLECGPLRLVGGLCGLAMGGMLNPNCPTKAHFHNFYFRIDLDIDGQFPHDVCEIFNHGDLNDPGGDKWDTVPKQMKLLADPDSSRKWRVRNTVSKNKAGEFKGYEIELPQLGGRTPFSTGDVWVTIYRGDGIQQPPLLVGRNSG